MSMSEPRRAAVIDIGKTNAKVALTDMRTYQETAVRKMPNLVLREKPYPHFDMEGQWNFALASLKALHAEQPFDAISITTHGASAALVRQDGSLALPVLDYEHDGPDGLTAEYDSVRPPFSETFSPRLRIGLNLGAQIFWQRKRFPKEFAQTAHILAMPQYWAMRLTGVAASEATSLGAHTDLWQPAKAEFSSLVTSQGWRALFPPLRSAFDVLGPLRPEIAAQLGIKRPMPVSCGIHDSNASLLPHLMARTAPFSVVSTGTWVIIFSAGADLDRLDPSRDCLANVDAFSRPVASARFMGGREYEMTAPPGVTGNDESLREVLDQTILLLPSVERTSGPFQGMASAWQPVEPQGPARASAASLYLAMMTATSLDLSGGRGDVIVEGPFARNSAFLDMLAVAAGRDVIPMAGSSTGTSLGAALLALGRDHVLAMDSPAAVTPSPKTRAGMERWRDAWNAAVLLRRS
jgi:sugar (pentulose or hexulose) kinase